MHTYGMIWDEMQHGNNQLDYLNEQRMTEINNCDLKPLCEQRRYKHYRPYSSSCFLLTSTDECLINVRHCH